MKKIFLIILGFSIALSNPLDRYSNAEIVKALSNYMNKNAGKKLDAITRIEGATYSKNNNIIITKSFDLRDSKVRSFFYNNKRSFIKEMFKADSKNACNNESTRYLIYKRHIYPIFRYVNYSNKKLLFSYKITSTTCKRLK